MANESPDTVPDLAREAFLAGLASAIRATRGAKGWTVRDLARRSGVSERFVVQIEAKHANVSVARLRSLAEALGASASAWVAAGEAAARDRKSTRLNSSHIQKSRMPSSA